MNDDRLNKLRQQAESQMRREAPDIGPNKRAKFSHSPEIGRFKYTAIHQLLQGAKGFVLTSSFKREKSAIKEAFNLLKPYLPASLFTLQSTNPSNNQLDDIVVSEIPDDATMEDTPKGEGFFAEKISETTPEKTFENSDKSCTHDVNSFNGFGVIKLSCQGVIMLILPQDLNDSIDPVDVVRKVIRDVTEKLVSVPRFCQRIQPLEVTCAFTESSIREAATLVGRSFIRKQGAEEKLCDKVEEEEEGEWRKEGEKEDKEKNEEKNQEDMERRKKEEMEAKDAPAYCKGTGKGKNDGEKGDLKKERTRNISYAVSFKSRASGLEEASSSASKKAKVPMPSSTLEAESTSSPSSLPLPIATSTIPLLDPIPDRRSAVVAAAAGFESSLSKAGIMAKVDLKAPEVAILCDIFPVGKLLIAGLALLADSDMFWTKPRLVIRPLAQ